MLTNSGKTFVQQFMSQYGIEVKDKDGNKDTEATNKIEEAMAKSYDVLFQYLCDKITDASITAPSTVTGPHTNGAYTGVTQGKVQLMIK